MVSLSDGLSICVRRSVGRFVGRSVGQSVGQAVDRSIGPSVRLLSVGQTIETIMQRLEGRAGRKTLRADPVFAFRFYPAIFCTGAHRNTGASAPEHRSERTGTPERAHRNTEASAPEHRSERTGTPERIGAASARSAPLVHVEPTRSRPGCERPPRWDPAAAGRLSGAKVSFHRRQKLKTTIFFSRPFRVFAR